MRRSAISELMPTAPALFAFMSALSARNASAAAVRSSGARVPSSCSEPRVFHPTNNCVPLNQRREICGDHRAARGAAIIGSKRSIHAHGHPAVTSQQQVATSNASGLTGHKMLVVSFDVGCSRRSPVNSLRDSISEELWLRAYLHREVHAEFWERAETHIFRATRHLETALR